MNQFYTNMLRPSIRAIIYVIVFLALWGYRMSRFILNEPIDVLTNFGKSIFIPSLSHEDIILMIGRAAIMYAIFIISAFSIAEGLLKFSTNSKTFFKAFVVILIILSISEIYWESNCYSLISRYMQMVR